MLDRVAKMDFDPDAVVLLDKNVAWDQRMLVAADPSVWQGASRGGGSRARADIMESAKPGEDMPEFLRVRVSNCSGGYLVLADSYFPGWSALIVDDRGAGREVPILPAYGALRAVGAAGERECEGGVSVSAWSWRGGGDGFA